MITITHGSRQLKFQQFLFPAGEVGVKLNTGDYAYLAEAGPQVITARLGNPSEIIDLIMLKDALSRFCSATIQLVMPYVPYARQDRVCVPGEAFSIIPFADLIRSLKFDRVTIFDPHSSVTEAALRPDKVVTQFDIVTADANFGVRMLSPVSARQPLICAPDASAAKRIKPIVDYFGRPLIIAEKIRDMATGAILRTEVHCDADLKGKDVVMFDDICDGGKTFTEIAKVLKAKNSGRVLLYVTHGLFTKGLYALTKGGIDEIWTTDTVPQPFEGHPEIKVFNCTQLLSK
jgi:ribose-phosphate pyrophosphokinase